MPAWEVSHKEDPSHLGIFLDLAQTNEVSHGALLQKAPCMPQDACPLERAPILRGRTTRWSILFVPPLPTRNTMRRSTLPLTPLPLSRKSSKHFSWWARKCSIFFLRAGGRYKIKAVKQLVREGELWKNVYPETSFIARRLWVNLWGRPLNPRWPVNYRKFFDRGFLGCLIF